MRTLDEKARMSRIVLKGRNRTSFIKTDSVLFLQAMDHNVLIYTLSGVYKLRRNISQAEQSLNCAGFLRVHRSYIVSVDHISEIEDGFAVLDDPKKTEIPIGDLYTRSLTQEIINRYYIIL